MNRRVSIPTSRSIIDLPITPNMVTFFTLGVIFAAVSLLHLADTGTLLLGAALLDLGLSLLDGCDGEVARLKLQASDLAVRSTVCDYLYYVLIFSGMSIGLARTMGRSFALVWGTVLLFGAVPSFLVVGFAHHHFSPERPDRLAIWQKKAEKRSSNPFLYVGGSANFSFGNTTSLMHFWCSQWLMC